MNRKTVILMASLAIIVVVIASLAYYYYIGLTSQIPEELKTITMGTTDTLENLDITRLRGKVAYMLSSMIYDLPLMPEYDGTEARSWIVKDWTVSDDELTWTVTLVEGVKYHDGTPLNATSVKFHFDRYMENGTLAYIFNEHVESVEVLGEFHLAFHLLAAFGSFPSLLYNYASGLESPTAVIKLGDDVFDSQPVGVGPWKFVEWIRGEKLVLERNEEYWNKDFIPKVDRWIINFYSDPGTLKMSLLSGEIDMVYRIISPIDVPSLKESPDIHYILFKNTYFRYFATTHTNEPLSNKLVRQAIAHAIDREEIVELAMKGLGIPAWTGVSEDIFGDFSLSSFERYEHNATKARELLAQAGYADGFTLTLDYTSAHYGATEVDVALIIRDQLAEVGITVELASWEWATYVGGVYTGVMGHDIWLRGWVRLGEYCDPVGMVDYYALDGGLISGAVDYHRPENNELIHEAYATANMTLKKELLHELQNIVAEDIPIIPLFFDVEYIWYRYDLHNVVWPTVDWTFGPYSTLIEKD